ncbi:MAG TPA: M15 family metallopeptidase [Coleofasciculaceae cyanobacterium]
MKPHYQVPIQECGEPLLPIPPQLARVDPHPYTRLGAPYGERSPFFVRQGVCDRLLLAQTQLERERPGWQIQIFDGYRPIAVQQFMVDHTLQTLAQAQGLDPQQMTVSERQTLLTQVYEFWALPSLNPATPPPHSTGGAIDVTLVDQSGHPLDMGSPIDEISPRSYPDYFKTPSTPEQHAFNRHRQQLKRVMTMAGFEQHPNEWWHFCWGDQMWAWLVNQADSTTPAIARYGRCD